MKVPADRIGGVIDDRRVTTDARWSMSLSANTDSPNAMLSH
jgi:hypothetical protein